MHMLCFIYTLALLVAPANGRSFRRRPMEAPESWPCPTTPDPPPGPDTVQALSVVPAKVPIEGGVTLTISGRNFNVSASNPTCRIRPALWGTTNKLLGDGTGDILYFAAKVVSSTTIECTPPDVTAEGPGGLHVSMDNHTWVGPNWAHNGFWCGLNITYIPLVEVAVGRRPYIAEEEGELLVRTHSSLRGAVLKVEAELPATAARWGPWDVQGGVDTVLPLSFAELPAAVHNDILVTAQLPGGRKVYKWRRFHRVPPSPSPTVEAVQIDHRTGGVLVAGKPWMGHGWYMGDYSTRDQLHNLTLQMPNMTRKGVNTAMIYGLNGFSHADQIWFLDQCAKYGFKIIYPPDFGGCNVQRGGPFDPKHTAELKRNISWVKNHTAIFGYYVCDDCCTNQVNISMMAQGYVVVKDADPYHLVVGAVDCDNLWMFTDIPSFLPPEAPRTAVHLPEAQQPALQLSLDYIMIEAYGRDLASEDAWGTWEGQVGRDGDLRHGVPFGTIVNCLDPGYFKILPKIRTMAWLGAVMAGSVNTLNWVWTSWLNETKWETHVEDYASEMKVLVPFLLTEFGGARPSIFATPEATIRARVWKRSGSTSLCAVVAVVNVAESGEPVRFEATLGDLPIAPTGATAMRLFTNPPATLHVNGSGSFTDTVAPHDVNVYQVGCSGSGI